MCLDSQHGHSIISILMSYTSTRGKFLKTLDERTLINHPHDNLLVDAS